MMRAMGQSGSRRAAFPEEQARKEGPVGYVSAPASSGVNVNIIWWDCSLESCLYWVKAPRITRHVHWRSCVIEGAARDEGLPLVVIAATH